MIQLALSGYPHGTIREYLTGTGAWMSTLGREQEWKGIRGETTLKALKDGMRKRDGQLGVRTRRKPALSIEALRGWAKNLQWEDTEEVLALTIATIGFIGLCRLGELVWPDAEAMRKVILRCTTECPVGSEAVLTLPYQKNDR